MRKVTTQGSDALLTLRPLGEDVQCVALANYVYPLFIIIAEIIV